MSRLSRGCRGLVRLRLEYGWFDGEHWLMEMAQVRSVKSFGCGVGNGVGLYWWKLWWPTTMLRFSFVFLSFGLCWCVFLSKLLLSCCCVKIMVSDRSCWGRLSDEEWWNDIWRWWIWMMMLVVMEMMMKKIDCVWWLLLLMLLVWVYESLCFSGKEKKHTRNEGVWGFDILVWLFVLVGLLCGRGRLVFFLVYSVSSDWFPIYTSKFRLKN